MPANAASDPPHVHVIALGGTIAMTDQGGGARPSLGPDELVGAVPDLSAVARLTTSQVAHTAGPGVGFDDLRRVVAAAVGAVDGGAVGIVVTQGTDTIEESVVALDLWWDRPEPVVVVGAMRNPSLPGADGPANLLGAVQVAAAASARGIGVTAMLDETIHAARFVAKRHTHRPSAFSSAPFGPLGAVTDAGPRLVMRIDPAPTLPVPDADATWPVVPVVTAVLGDDGAGVSAALDAGADAIVLAGFGGGHAAPAMVGPLERAAARAPVVLASRTGAGALLSRTYGFPGSETDLAARGLLSAGHLDPLKARMAVVCALAVGRTDALAQLLSTYGAGA